MIKTYDWALDNNPSRELSGNHLGLATTKTYEYLRDGIWIMHVRAMNTAGQWGPTAHRTIRVDGTPPKSALP